MSDIHPETTDSLARLVDSSAPFRLISRAGDQLVVAWRESTPAALAAAWTALPLDRRVRLMSVVVAVAVVTHVALTGFNAPEPTWWARTAWIIVLATSAVIAVAAPAVAAAWTHWIARRHVNERSA